MNIKNERLKNRSWINDCAVIKIDKKYKFIY